MKLPVSFSEFKKNPQKAILYIALVAIMYLYVDNKMVYTNQIEKQENRITLLEGKVDNLQNKILEIAQK